MARRARRSHSLRCWALGLHRGPHVGGTGNARARSGEAREGHGEGRGRTPPRPDPALRRHVDAARPARDLALPERQKAGEPALHVPGGRTAQHEQRPQGAHPDGRRHSRAGREARRRPMAKKTKVGRLPVPQRGHQHRLRGHGLRRRQLPAQPLGRELVGADGASGPRTSSEGAPLFRRFETYIDPILRDGRRSRPWPPPTPSRARSSRST